MGWIFGAVLLAGVFASSAWDHIRDPNSFSQAIIGYKLVPPRFTKWTARVLSWLELTTAVLLLSPVPRLGAFMGLALLILFTGAVTTNLIRGYANIACGCGGVLGQDRLTWWLVLRNVPLLVLCLALPRNAVSVTSPGLDVETRVLGIALGLVGPLAFSLMLQAVRVHRLLRQYRLNHDTWVTTHTLAVSLEGKK